jgi:fucose permease
MKNRLNFAIVAPVLLSFFVMSFIDLVGTGVDELRQSSDIPAYILQLIPFVAFIWFFVLSVPIGIWQDKIGSRKTLNYGLLITAAGLLTPALGNNLPVILAAFALLGIGNTILQVSANPLLVSVVPGDRSSSFLSFSQFIKSLGSMAGPFVAGLFGPFMAKMVGDESSGSWRYGLYLFALISLLSWAWLSYVTVNETKPEGKKASLSSCFKLLGNNYVLLMVLGIFLVVGIDVSINSNIGSFLTGKLGVDENSAKYAKSLYFFAKMAGTFFGAIMLVRWSPRKFLAGSAAIATVALLLLALNSNVTGAWVLISVASLGISNIFPLIFSLTVARLPQRANEISGLMMMAISGGALIPFLTGYAMKFNLSGGIFVMMACALYLLILSLGKHGLDSSK